MGLRPCAAIELEFHLIDSEPGPDGAPQVPHNARLAARGRGTEVYAADRLDDQDAFLTLAERWCAAQGLVVKSALCEYAPGQLELNLGHTEDMLLAADEAMMLKRCIKAAARATGQRATFMAKPYADQAGNGLHIHVSLLDEGGRNAFGEVPDGEQRLRHAVRGLQALMPESMLLFAPNANSYRRLQPLSYAPTAPTWGHNNRTVAVRIPSGSGGRPPPRASGRRCGRQPLSGAGSRSRRHPARPRSAGASRARPPSATPTPRPSPACP